MFPFTEKARLKKEIRFYGIVVAVCLILAAGINAWMSQGSQEGRESESLRSLKLELELYRKDHGGKANREDLIKIWQSYEGKLSPEEINKLKQDYRAKLDPAEAEAVRKAYEETKGKNP